MAQMHPFQREVATSYEVYLIKPELRVFVLACLRLNVYVFVIVHATISIVLIHVLFIRLTLF